MDELNNEKAREGKREGRKLSHFCQRTESEKERERERRRGQHRHARLMYPE